MPSRQPSTGVSPASIPPPPPRGAIGPIVQPARRATSSTSTSRSAHPVRPVEPISDDDRGRDHALPSTLVSFVVHLAFMIALALWTVDSSPGRGNRLRGSLSDPRKVVNLETSKPPERIDLNDHDEAADVPVKIDLPAATVASATIAPRADRVGGEDLEGTLSIRIGGGGIESNSLVRIPSGGGLSGRSPEKRVELGQRYGATAGGSEAAVEMALKWLANHQARNGSWSFNLKDDPCGGRCGNGRPTGDPTPTPSTAATGLALLAFLGAGYTPHTDNPYSDNVRRGLYHLRQAAAPAQGGYDWQQGSMYGHGIALMAMAEAWSMEPSNVKIRSDLEDLVRGGVRFSEAAQHSLGSWGYVPGSPGDTTLTGWQVLSLIAAARNLDERPTPTLVNAKRYLDSVNDGEFGFGYKRPVAEPTTTAIGLTLALYLGQSPDSSKFRLAVDELADRGPTMTNIYHDYYATMLLHHLRHHRWDHWNTQLRDHLVSTQATEGHERGSWHFDDRWGNVGGRLYTTAMATLTLEVYYRYLPLYGDAEFRLD